MSIGKIQMWSLWAIPQIDERREGFQAYVPESLPKASSLFLRARLKGKEEFQAYVPGFLPTKVCVQLMRLRAMSSRVIIGAWPVMMIRKEVL
eukprot:29856-Amphidinium_carterae.1